MTDASGEESLTSTAHMDHELMTTITIIGVPGRFIAEAKFTERVFWFIVYFYIFLVCCNYA